VNSNAMKRRGVAAAATIAAAATLGTAAVQAAAAQAAPAAAAGRRQLAVTTLSNFKVVLTATRAAGHAAAPSASVTAAGYKHTGKGWKLIATKTIGKPNGWYWYSVDVCSITVTQLKPEPSSASPSDRLSVSLLMGPALGCAGTVRENFGTGR
jgi:hypothetical protein